VAAIGAGFDHRLGQFLDKERHPVGALDDLVDDIRRQCPRLAASRATSVAPSLRPSRFSAITSPAKPGPQAPATEFTIAPLRCFLSTRAAGNHK